MSVITKIHNSVYLEMPFSMESISKLEISQKLNEHSWAQIEGIIQDKNVDTCSNLSWNKNFTIKLVDAQTSQILFSGMPVHVKVSREDQTYVTIRLSSYSILLDYEKRTRSFQQREKTFASVFQELVKGNGGDIINFASASATFDAPLIQYEETDWEFLKRASSLIGASVYPCASGTSAQIYIGFGSNESRLSGTPCREMKKSIREFRQFRNSAPSESDFISCNITGNKDCRLGDRVMCDGHAYRVTEIQDSLKNGLLSRRCLLKQESGICREKKYQEKLQGVSLPGVVREVKTDRIRLHLDIDGKRNREKLHWYPWHRNDWFCMPEIGSKVMLYIPTKDETMAYATDISRLDQESSLHNQNPEKKCFETKSGKGMMMESQSISFQATGNKISVRLSDRSGVKVRSSKGIQIHSGESFQCRSKNMNIESGERIVLSTGMTSIVIDDLIQVKG